MNYINAYAHISSATTTQVFTGACSLVAIIVNATSAGTITIVDNTTGTTPVVGVLKASIAEGTYNYGAPAGITLSTGLRVITGGASDITVVYRVQ
jgi:hypothetical protein